MKILASVLHLIARALDVDEAELHDGYELTGNLADLAMDLEADLSVEVPDEEAERWATVGDVVRGMKRLLAEAKEADRGMLTGGRRGKAKKKPSGRVEQGSLLP